MTVKDQEQIQRQAITFQIFAALLLGSITGLLIVFPIVLSSGTSPLSVIVFIAGILAGGLVGYRNRESRGFLYLCFVAILVLAGTLSSSMTSSISG